MRIEELYQKLGFAGKDGFAALSDAEWASKVTLPKRVLSLIEEPEGPLHQMSALFVFGGKPLIFFFDKPQNTENLFKTIWNLNEVPIVVIMNDDHVDVYNGFKYENELRSLSLIGDDDVLGDLEYFKVVTGHGWDEFKTRLGYRNRVDYYLLKNIEVAQKQIQATSITRNLANRLIGKMIFLRYLTDRHVTVSFEGRKQVLTNDDLIALLKDKTRLADLFETLQDKDKGFNGDLFKISKNELLGIPDAALEVLVRLLSSDDLETNSRSLFDVYDFSILPIEFISNVYERFIGKENQESEGAYYTPYFLVDYMVENTVAKRLAQSVDSSCKVLDPACGSGIFLVETLRRIIDHYKAHATAEELQGRAFQDTLRKLATDNIFGIDSDESAIQVAAFSIYLTLLDYQQPADISNFRFPNLLGANLICQDAFEEAPFAGIKFDYILGNPPWNRGHSEVDENGKDVEAAYEKYIKLRAHKEGKGRIIGNNEIAQAFAVRTFDFMSEETKAALVLTSKVLYNSQSAPFRTYLLDNVLVDSVLELSSVRKEVFSQSSDPSIAPACVLFYQKKQSETNALNHLVTHTAIKPSVFFTLFKVLTVEKADIQHVRQDLLEQYDYLWKILLFGSYLDFLFVKRLKSMKSIQEEIDERSYLSGVGVTVGSVSTRHDDIRRYLGKKLVEAGKLQQYYILPSHKEWKEPFAHRGREASLFKSPLLLVRKSISSKDYTCRASICEEDVIYTGSITGICGEDMGVLRNITGMLNSFLFPYYALMNLSSIGTEREQGFNIEKFSLPYIGGGIAGHVERIETLYKDLETVTAVSQDEMKEKIRKEKDSIDNIVVRELNMTATEKSLVDYAVNYTIPFVTGKCKVQSVMNDTRGHKVMSAYADVFLERFNGQFGKGTYLSYVCEIAPSHVMVRFFVSMEQKAPDFKNGSLGAMEAFLLSLSVEGVSDNLYLRKDIRGFEENGFYIIKPSEQRLWHPAVAYVDVEEFVDAILTNKGNTK